MRSSADGVSRSSQSRSRRGQFFRRPSGSSLPSGVVFDATGRVSPKPREESFVPPSSPVRRNGADLWTVKVAMTNWLFAGGTTFDPATGEVRRGGATTRLEPQPALVLSLLIRHAGQLVTHDEIRRAIWGDQTHVDFRDGVHYCIRQVRVALGDDARSPRVIATVPKRGYRLDAGALVRNDPAEADARAGDVPLLPPACQEIVLTGRWGRRIIFTGLAAGLGMATIIVERAPNNHHAIAVALLKSVHDFIF
jgi:DNA-binding winged helix-turn-helix (wHTH) protein